MIKHLKRLQIQALHAIMYQSEYQSSLRFVYNEALECRRNRSLYLIEQVKPISSY